MILPRKEAVVAKIDEKTMEDVLVIRHVAGRPSSETVL